MSLELIDNIINNWDDPNYEGLNIEYNVSDHQVDDLINNKIIKDIEELQYTKYKDIEQHSKLITFYKDLNFWNNGYEIEDRSMDYEKSLKTLIGKNVKNILEVGFNSGILTSMLLETIKHINITSIDPFNYAYSWYGKLFIDYKYPGRHNLIMSTVNNLVPVNNKYDMILIKGDYINLYKTINLLRYYADEHTIIIMDSICPHLNYGFTPYAIMLKLIKDKILSLEEHIKINKNYNNGLAILRFSKSPSNNIYKDIEINIPTKEFEYCIYNTTLSIKTIKEYLRRFENLNITLNNSLMNYIKENYNI